jgi:hypothetical protein
VREKLGRATASLHGRDPESEAELDALLRIEELDTRLQDAARELQEKHTDVAQEAFYRAAQELKKALQHYAAAFHRTDIEATTHEVTVAQALRLSMHVPPSVYRKHWRGTSDEERRQSSSGASQFRYTLSEAEVAAYERDTLLTGQVENKGGTFHAYKQYSVPLGWEKGRPAYWLRAELTGVDPDSATPKGSIHSHPRSRGR